MIQDSRSLIDPELRDMAGGAAPLALSMDNLADVRDFARRPPPLYLDFQVDTPVFSQTRAAPGPKGAPDVLVLIHRPSGAIGPLPCILHMHGGGFVAGSPHADAPQHDFMAVALSCCVVSVDYRLAPENPFPAAIEDCYAVLCWLAASCVDLDIDPARIGVMGESAGGGLAAALALLARDRGGPKIAFQHLIYPMLDDRTCVSATPHPYAGQCLWTPHNNRFGWSQLLGGDVGGPEVSAYAAPARAHDLTGLPPAFIAVGALDLLIDEDLDYARRLTRAGAPVELHVYPGAFHAFDFHRKAAVAAQARADSLGALARTLYPTLAAGFSQGVGETLAL